MHYMSASSDIAEDVSCYEGSNEEKRFCCVGNVYNAVVLYSELPRGGAACGGGLKCTHRVAFTSYLEHHRIYVQARKCSSLFRRRRLYPRLFSIHTLL
jgi:hypothetical protein